MVRSWCNVALVPERSPLYIGVHLVHQQLEQLSTALVILEFCVPLEHNVETCSSSFVAWCNKFAIWVQENFASAKLSEGCAPLGGFVCCCQEKYQTLGLHNSHIILLLWQFDSPDSHLLWVFGFLSATHVKGIQICRIVSLLLVDFTIQSLFGHWHWLTLWVECLFGCWHCLQDKTSRNSFKAKNQNAATETRPELWRALLETANNEHAEKLHLLSSQAVMPAAILAPSIFLPRVKTMLSKLPGVSSQISKLGGIKQWMTENDNRDVVQFSQQHTQTKFHPVLQLRHWAGAIFLQVCAARNSLTAPLHSVSVTCPQCQSLRKSRLRSVA